MATDGGPKQRRPRKPPVVVREHEREVEQEDVAPDSESPERLRRASWRWFKKDELAAQREVVEEAPVEVVAVQTEIVAEQTNEEPPQLEPVAEIVANAAPDNVEPVAEEPASKPVEAEATEAAPAAETTAEAAKPKRAPRKKKPEPVAVFRARAAAFFRSRRAANSVPGAAAPAPVRIEDATKTSGSVARAHLKGVLEALIFASEHPLSSRELAKSASADHRVVTSLLAELMDEYRGRGVRLDEVAGGYVFRTSPAFAPFVREHVSKKPVKMTRAQVETLAIIAYKQPITRPEIDEVRGVDSGAILKSLLERDLVKILGKKEEAGRPLLYGTSPAFLEFFGLKALGELPTLREFTELTDESRRMYEREMGEEPMDPSVVLTNDAGFVTEGDANGGLMGAEGELRSATGASGQTQQFEDDGAVNEINDSQQGEAAMNSELVAEVEDLEAQRVSAENEDEDEDLEDEDEDEDEDLEDEDEDEDEDFDDEDEDEDDEDEDDEDDEDEDEDDEDFDDEDEDDEDFDDEDEDEDEDEDDEDEEDDDE